MRKTWLATAALALAAALLVAGCSGQPLSTREKGTGIGALLGAGTGAIIGAAVGSPGAGAAIGGAVGAGAGVGGGEGVPHRERTQRATPSHVRTRRRASAQH